MIFCTYHRYIVASHDADYSAPPKLYCIQELDMNDPHHVCVRVHLRCSVTTEVKITTPGYIAIIHTNKCTQLYYIYMIIITKTTNSYMLHTLLVHHHRCATPPTDQQAAPTNIEHFCLLHIFYTNNFQQLFYIQQTKY
jgi:hypothetical protein